MKYTGYVKTKDGIDFLKKVGASYEHAEKNSLLKKFHDICVKQRDEFSDMLSGVLDDKNTYPMYHLEDAGWPIFYSLTDCYYIADFYARATNGLS